MTEFWLEYETSVKEEGGSGGVVALTEVTTGYKVFPQGVDQDKAYFPAAAGDKAAREKAKKAAAALNAEHGLTGRPQWGIMIRLDRKNAFVRGQAATWEADLFKWSASYTDGCKEVIVPSLKELKLGLPWKGWARVAQRPDPYYVKKGDAGMTDTDQNGEPRFPAIWYVAEVYPDKEAAMEVVGTMVSAEVEELPPVPSGYDTIGEWEAMHPEIVSFLKRRIEKGMPEAEAIMKAAEEYGVDAGYIQPLMSDVSPV